MVLAGGRRVEAAEPRRIPPPGRRVRGLGARPGDRIRRFFLELQLTHSFPVRRVAELQKWVRSGEYDRIVGGDYVKRGEEVDPRTRRRRRGRVLLGALPNDLPGDRRERRGGRRALLGVAPRRQALSPGRRRPSRLSTEASTLSRLPLSAVPS